MLKLKKLQKQITQELANKQIKSINDFCEKLYYSMIFDSEKKVDEKYTKIRIYSERNNSVELAIEFKVLMQYYIENKYIQIENNTSLPILKPFWDYDTRYRNDNMSIFHDLNDLCVKYAKKRFIIIKPIKLKILALFGKLVESNDFKFKIFKNIKLHIEKNSKFYTVLIALITLVVVILSWIYDFANFQSMIKSIFQ